MYKRLFELVDELRDTELSVKEQVELLSKIKKESTKHIEQFKTNEDGVYYYSLLRERIVNECVHYLSDQIDILCLENDKPIVYSRKIAPNRESGSFHIHGSYDKKVGRAAFHNYVSKLDKDIARFIKALLNQEDEPRSFVDKYNYELACNYLDEYPCAVIDLCKEVVLFLKKCEQNKTSPPQ